MPYHFLMWDMQIWIISSGSLLYSYIDNSITHGGHRIATDFIVNQIFDWVEEANIALRSKKSFLGNCKLNHSALHILLTSNWYMSYFGKDRNDNFFIFLNNEQICIVKCNTWLRKNSFHMNPNFHNRNFDFALVNFQSLFAKGLRLNPLYY